MSAKDAPGEVNNKNRQGDGAISPNFDDSPNISSAVDEEQQAIAAEEAAKKQAETTLIDGIPIEGDDVKYKASEIKKKGKTEYFVNVEGAEKRKREAARKAREEAMMAEQEAIDAKRRAKANDERVVGELKKKAEAVKRRNKADDERVIGELKKKADVRKKQNRKAEVNAKRKAKRAKRNAFIKKHKKVIIVLALVVIIAIIVFAVSFVRIEKQKEAEGHISNYEKAFDIKTNINKKITDSNLDDPLIKAEEEYQEAIANAENDELRYFMRIYYAEFLYYYEGKYDDALAILDDVSDDRAEGLCEIYEIYLGIYFDLNNSEMVNKYDRLIINECENTKAEETEVNI